MKNLVLLFVIPILAGCDFSQFFKKEITAIVCADQIDLLPQEEAPFDLKDNINYNYFSNGQNQDNLSYYEYTTTLYFDNAHRNNFIDLGECHGAEGGAGGKYHHIFYTYPKTKKSAYGTLKTELDEHFSACIKKVKEDFLIGADKQLYDLESFYTTSTDGLFQIRKNQDGGNYSETIVSGTEQSEAMAIPTLNLKENIGSYSKINFNAPTITIRKSRATVKEPVYPVVRRITVNWTSDGLVYTGFIQEAEENDHDISVVENPDGRDKSAPPEFSVSLSFEISFRLNFAIVKPPV